ncbi:hypothetical protein U1E44_03385 [Arenibacter sp. GZD96]|uniref:hypothetical protein n=1 Tax=Aurantibrevibacter litoralis TaxID=3106030 RepID=UPI002AFF01BC|nr:hypothetical protein [Arenibacter sp. GZD-96]MEA1785121.1 hypothetical protein [Arenibacter sp. GZD-96]
MTQIKNIGIYLAALLLSTGCNSQEKQNQADEKEHKRTVSAAPKGAWKVNKEYDEAGNMVRYDSVYSWSTGTDLDHLASMDRDSILKSIQSKLRRNFSQFDFEGEGFGDFFHQDSLFSNRFFDENFFKSDFGQDVMDIHKIQERMEALQKQFLKRYGFSETLPQKEEDRKIKE